jgi:hypothetical protein
MLIGYDKEGEIRFVFSDEDYLRSKYPKNSAKISDFWKIKNHGLKELFIDLRGISNIKSYKVINGKLAKVRQVAESIRQFPKIDVKKLKENIGPLTISISGKSGELLRDYKPTVYKPY